MPSIKTSKGRVVVPPSKTGKGRVVGLGIGAVFLLGLIAVFLPRSGDDPGKAKPSSSASDDEGAVPAPRIVEAVAVPGAAAAGMPEQSTEGRTIPPEIAEKVRNWSPESTEFRLPEPGEEAPVRAYNLDTYDPTNPGPPPNPFIPPKRHLTEEDTRAGLDPVPE